MDEQKPSVGRIVHYYGSANVMANKGQPYPAIITHVWGACVNLFVFADGSNSAPFGIVAPGELITSVERRTKEGQERCWDWPAIEAAFPVATCEP